MSNRRIGGDRGYAYELILKLNREVLSLRMIYVLLLVVPIAFDHRIILRDLLLR